MNSESRITKLIGVILCGGQSRRMGCDKWAVPIAGRPMIDYVADALSDCDLITLSIGADARQVPAIAGATVVRDSEPDCGPLEGLRQVCRAIEVSGIEEQGGEPALAVLSCDVPFVTRQHIASLRRALNSGGDDAVIARSDQRVHPTIAIYRVDALIQALARGDEGKRRLDSLLDVMRCRIVDMESQAATNVNTPQDLEAAARRFASDG